MQNDNHPAVSSSTTFHKPAVSNLTKNLMSSTPTPSSSSTHMDYDSSNVIHSNVNSNASGNVDAANNSSNININISNDPPSSAVNASNINDSINTSSGINPSDHYAKYNSNINTNHNANDNDIIGSNIINNNDSSNSKIKTIINSINTNTNTNTNGNTVNTNNLLHPSARVPTAVPVTGSISFSSTEPTSSSFHSSSYRAPGFYSTPANDSINYIPSSHNTPTVVSSSYSSVHSYTPSLPNSNNLQSFTSTNSNVNPFNSSNTNDNQQQQHQQHQQLQNATKPSGFVPQSMPTTTISMDSVNSTSNRDSFASASSSFNPSFPVQPTPTPPLNQNQLQQSQNQQHRFPSSFGSAPFGSAPTSSSYHHHPYSRTANRPIPNTASSSVTATPPVDSGYLSSSHQHQQHQQQYIQPEPDHYMSYKEFLHNLSVRDGNNPPPGENASIYDGHLNIVDYPVNDLILMLSCLLTKIIEANDKLHPNHFDNTIAMRQRLKEERRMKKIQQAELKEQRRFARRQERERVRSANRSGSLTTSDSNMETTRQHSVGGALIVDVDVVDVGDEDDNIEVDHDDSNSHGNPIDIDSDEDEDEDLVIDSQDEDDEQDEMKNKYLANVLAFHGTNVPGISLHAYLARVLKYCPVTNEVFLSLLVYFDRIAKKANNLNQKRKTSSSGAGAGGAAINEDTANAGDAEQLFVMDSYNIHRLIISGITVSSKFFSDIFYKNLRYAKVGGLPLEELNYLELQFLLLLDFKLMISVEDLQNYGDLLLRFWKREQITNELVHNTNNTNNNSNASASNIGDPSDVGNQKDGIKS
ncbi:cyclin like protein interacting with PHO85 [Scheffersomyces stipitis CBS 6054]|uniref:Cyclin like protein interacting with PHO85 n=1 Tax=Scheffersomyces stipitis (strain ATCC 58785 / CBS 6054 / NBRC 10063 / NRRL Y-11545) TaxID=322104 RepID=A3GFL5_PICST|nr:cyclin like protein interacting with PHO85 [Scheffersomyces stipitis CBS 6054]EAZ63774.2 cyclin like protein interacting with PHO85 [Scheffersomyces stipitis CBS 6054]